MSGKRSKQETLEGLVDEAIGGIVDEATERTAREKKDAEERERKDRRNRIAVAVLLPLCIVLTILNFAGFFTTRAGLPPLSGDEIRTAQLLLLSDAVDEIDFFYDENGRYPAQPAFVGPDGPDAADEPFRYELMGSDRYVVSVTIAGLTMSYDSREDAGVVFEEVRDDR